MLTDLRGIEVRTVLFAATAMLALGGCAAGESAESPSHPASVDKRREVMEKEAQARTPTRAPNPQDAGNTGEVPAAIMNLFFDDLMLRALVRREAIEVREAVQRTWPDGSLGCATPGMNYIQVVTSGYRVKLSVNGRSYSYHSDLKGRFVLCDAGQPLRPAKRDSGNEPPAQ